MRKVMTRWCLSWCKPQRHRSGRWQDLLGGDALRKLALTRYHSDGGLDAAFRYRWQGDDGFGDASYGKSGRVRQMARFCWVVTPIQNGGYSSPWRVTTAAAAWTPRSISDGKVITMW